MLQRVTVEGIEFPRLYIAENDDDVKIARDAGVPYIKWKWGMESLIKTLLRPTLEKLFPYVKWNIVLGKKKPVRSDIVIVHGNNLECSGKANDFDAEEMLEAQLEYDGIVDDLGHSWQEPNENGEYVREVEIADSQRNHNGGIVDPDYGLFAEDRLSVGDYIGDLSSCVDIDALQKLGMLPKFMGNIADCVKHNISQSMHWTEGYTKKLGYPLGKFNSKGELPNVLIVDVSWSIPDGIAATLLTLVDTMRSLCNAELIITSRRSGYYPVGAELPKPQTLRDYYGRSNERQEFMAILEKYIAGREFGHVISFGDYDCPGSINGTSCDRHSIDMANTKVHEVHHYHTKDKAHTGYAEWVHECCPNVVEHFDTSWCKVIE